MPHSPLAAGGKKTVYVEGLLGGLLLGVILTRLLGGPRSLVRDEREVSKVSGTPVLGWIGYTRNKPLLVGDTEGHAGEAFRALRVNVFALSPVTTSFNRHHHVIPAKVPRQPPSTLHW